MLLSELLNGLKVLSEYEDREISNVTDKTHKISSGCAFVCVVGARFDGHSFAESAIKQGAKAVIVTVFGNRAIDDTLIELYDLAAAVGFKVIAGVEAVAEHSLARMYGAGRPNGDDKAELESFVAEIYKKLNANNLSIPQIPGNRPYREFKASSMSLVVDDTCINCKKCARECPVNAIPMDNVKTVDGDRCFSCMHCVSACPKNARHNSPEIMKNFEERLRERCAERKPNKLYI